MICPQNRRICSQGSGVKPKHEESVEVWTPASRPTVSSCISAYTFVLTPCIVTSSASPLAHMVLVCVLG